MTITNPETAGATVQRDATDAARRTLTAISLGTVAPEAYAGKLRSHDRLMGLVQGAFDRASSEALAIVGSARADIDGLRHDELRANPFASDCFGRASRSVRALPPSLDADSIKAAIAGLVDTSLEDACRDLDRNAARKLKMQRGTDRTRRRGKAEIDAYAQKLIPVLSAHIAGLVRDELAGELTRRYEAGERSQAALRRLCAEAADPGDDIPGSHRFSCGPRVEVVLKAVAARRPDLLDRDGRPTDAIWTAFGAEVAAGDLGVMEDPQQSIEALQRFLETTVAGALDGLTLDALYAVTREPPEVPSWIGRAAARLQAVSREKPYRVRLAQVPATTSDALLDQVLHHIQTAERSEEENRLQLVELTYAFCADEILQADPRGLKNVLSAILPCISNPRLAKAIGAQLASLGATRNYVVDQAEGDLVGNGATPEVLRQSSPT
jgi:hypothetical protein